ncbi:MAG TPA: class I SAM-dependent methyltransferase [Planctomicrobium sp.]|nr:class I SAM-dependent methyltransferase [Planctomicrobium sp.]
MAHDFSPHERFSQRVSDYVRSRPGYPAEVLTITAEELQLPHDCTVADIGSGTGIFSRLLLEAGYRVWGVEPNGAMRQAAEEQFRDNPKYVSLPGSSEQTGLPDGSVQLVTAAQAFHWFDLHRTRREFVRILQSPGNVLLVWNDRKRDGSDFLRGYDQFLTTHGIDYVELMQQSEEKVAALTNFFDPGTYRRRTLSSSQQFDFTQFVDRVLSSSYVPGKQHPQHATAMEALEELFIEHCSNGLVTFEYDVNMHLGQVS